MVAFHVWLAGLATTTTLAFAPISARIIIFMATALIAPIAAGFELVPIVARYRATGRVGLSAVPSALRGLGWLAVSVVAVMSLDAPSPEPLTVTAFLTVLAGQILGMQPMNGFEFLKHVRAQSDGMARMPIIFLTSSADMDSVMKAVDLQVDAYLLKPVMPNVLKSKIVTLMTRLMTA